MLHINLINDEDEIQNQFTYTKDDSVLKTPVISIEITDTTGSSNVFDPWSFKTFSKPVLIEFPYEFDTSDVECAYWTEVGWDNSYLVTSKSDNNMI